MPLMPQAFLGTAAAPPLASSPCITTANELAIKHEAVLPSVGAAIMSPLSSAPPGPVVAVLSAFDVARQEAATDAVVAPLDALPKVSTATTAVAVLVHAAAASLGRPAQNWQGRLKRMPLVC